MQDDVGEKQGEGETAPDNGFDGVLAESFPAGYAGNEAHFEKNDGNGKTASHPLAMLLDFTVEDEGHGDAGSEHPQNGVHGGGDAEGASRTGALLEMLDVKAEGSSDEYTSDVEAPDDAMELGKAAAEALRKLHGAEQEGAGAHYAVGQEPPLEGLDVRPFGIFGVNEEMLVVAKNVGDHDADDGEQNVFWARPREAPGREWGCRQFWLLSKAGRCRQHTLKKHAAKEKTDGTSGGAWERRGPTRCRKLFPILL